MKNQLSVWITIALLLTTKDIVAQVSTPSNSGGAIIDYVGWQLNENKDLNIVNEDRYPIKFYTDGGVGGGGMWNNFSSRAFSNNYFNQPARNHFKAKRP